MATEGRPRRPGAAARSALDWLEAESDTATFENMGSRYGIRTDRAFGVPMARMKVLAERLGTDHDLAAELWASGWYEAHIVAAMVDDADAVDVAQMVAWRRLRQLGHRRHTVCFNLFDRTAHAWVKVDQWATDDREFVKRAGFALLWSLALHDRTARDDRFVLGLELIERESGDGRHLVDKAVGMALRAFGKRRASLTNDAIAVAGRLAASGDRATRRIGRPALDALRRSVAAERIE